MTKKEFFDKIQEIENKYLKLAKEEKNKIVITALDLLETPEIGDLIYIGEEQILIDKKEKYWDFYNTSPYIRCSGFVVKKKGTLTKKRRFVDYDLEEK